MRRLLFISLITAVAISLISCSDSGTGPDPGNDNEEEETDTPTYSVSADVNPSDAGTIAPGADTTYEEGEEVELEATPNDEYLFSEWTGDVESNDNPLSLTVDQDYELTAHFERKNYELTTNTEGDGAIQEDVLEQKSKEYEHGTVVELTASPAEGYKFVEWQGDLTGTENPAQITVDDPKEVTAVFEKKSYALTTDTEGEGAVAEEVVQQKSTDYEHGTVVELSANPAEGYAFVEWTGDLSGSDNPAQITVDKTKEVTAVFEKKDYELTVETSGQGSVAKSPDQSAYAYDTEVELSADPGEGYAFAEWQGDVTGTDNPAQITVEESQEVTAVFEKKSYALTTNTEGEGTVAEEVVQQKTTDYEHGTVVELTANAADGYEFVEWTGDLESSDNPSQITVDDPKEVTAVFEKKSYALTVNTDGNGSVTKSPDQSTYENGTTVELEAVPDEGHTLAEWTGAITSTDNPVEITIDEEKEVTAVFEEEQEQGKFYLAENGVTIKCPEAEYGDTGTVDGVTYTKRSRNGITPTNAPTTCTSGITDMKFLFLGDSDLTGDISHWDVSSVTNMSQMFEGAYNFNGDLSHWDVSAVTNMSEMFSSTDSFNQDLSAWDVSNVTDMSQMFREANYNQDLNDWDVSSVTNMEQMFYQAENFNGNINGWDVSKVTNMVGMFEYAESFNQDLNNWNLSAETNMEEMFEGASAFNGNVSSWNVSNVKNMKKMFYRASSFNGDISSWDVSNVTDMNQMFRYASSFNQNIGSWNISSVTDLMRMFADAESFNQDLNGWDVSGITRMYGLFQDATSFNGEISSWDVSNVEDMQNMFNGASSFNGDLSDWNTSSVTNMRSIFKDASSFDQDLNSWGVSSVENMVGMFQGAESFNQDLDDWDVSSVVDMHNMFRGATLFNGDISSWNTGDVTDMRSMFEDAFSFNQFIGNWDVSSAAISSMFYNASSFNQNLSGWCVEGYSSEPSNFSTNSALTESNMPEWGTCPGS